MLAAAARDLRGQGRGVPRASTRANPERAGPRAYEQRFKMPYDSIYDPTGRTLLAFRGTLPANAIPSTVVVDAEGRVAGSVIGTDHPDHALRPRRGRRGHDRPRRRVQQHGGRPGRCCWPCRWRCWPARCRSSPRACCRCCPATSPTPPGCPASTSRRPSAAGWRSAACCSCSGSPRCSCPTARCSASWATGCWTTGGRSAWSSAR